MVDKQKELTRPSFGIAFLAVIFLFVLLVVQVIQVGGPDIHLTLIFAISFATIVLMLGGMKWKRIEEGIIHGCKIATIPMLILMLIGMLIPTWIASGTIPVLMYYGLQLISPSMFLFTAALICGIASMSTGSSYTTGATFGVAFMGISMGLGIPGSMAAGAIISGAIIGDKLSPLSDSTNLAAGVCEANLFKHIILVPIFGLFLKQKIGIKCWIGVALGTVGIYFLSLTEALTIQPGDLIVLIGAAFWAIHVLVIDHFNPYVNAAKLSMMQFAVCASYGTIAMLIFERPSLESILSAAIPILYAGVLSAGIGFTFQILGQKNTSPTVASLLLSMEAVFAVIFGIIILSETMSSRELLGCILMFIAIIISQLPSKSVTGSDQIQ
jgi:uncharacterized membrane protein